MTELGTVDAVHEVLLTSEVSAARGALGHRVVVQQADALAVLPEGDAAETLAEIAPPLRAAASHEGDLLVLTDEALTVLSAGDLAATPLAEALGAVPEELAGSVDATWIRTGETLWLLQGDILSRVAVENRTFTGPLAAGVAEDGTPVAWIGADGHLLALDAAGELHLDHAIAPAALAADRGGAWIVADGELVRATLDGALRRYALEAPITAVAADPAAAGAWLLAGDVVHVTSDGEAETFDRLDGGFTPDGLAADPMGRLLAWDGDLHRVTAGRLIEVIGLDHDDVIDEAATIELWPSAPEEIEWVAVTVDERGLETVPGDDGSWTVHVDAVDWADGKRHTFVATASYTGGQAARSEELRFSAGVLGEVGWAAHVEPLAQQHCFVCHAGDTATLLDTSERWQSNIDSILEQVAQGSMPLAADPLTDGQIAVITAWRDGGFLP